MASTRTSQLRHAVVYIVAKAPRAGEVKTRLCPPLQPQQAARLATAFLQDTMGVVRQAGIDVRLICRGEAEREALTLLAERYGETPVHVQRGTGLGAALETAFERGLADGYAAVGVLGADSPALPPDVLRAAFTPLLQRKDADVVLGPADDGGYYLLAARQLYPALFRDMRWSTSTVLAETVRRCAAAGLQVRHLASCLDVDDVAGLRRLRALLAGAAAEVAPRTRAVLAGLPKDPGRLAGSPVPAAGAPGGKA